MKDMRSWIIVATCVPAGALVFFAVAWLLGAPELAELRGQIKTTK